MPELPEVETVCRRLLPLLQSRELSDVEVKWRRSLKTHSPADLKEEICGYKITGVRRRAKFIVIDLMRSERKRVLMIHLRMSGDLLIRNCLERNKKHDRVIFHLNDGSRLCFNDIRKFGKIYSATTIEGVAPELGIEPLSNEFSWQKLKLLLKTARRRVKVCLLDQTLIAGIGNIYADESLWMAKIHPARIASSLTDNECRLLRNSIVKILKEAIDKKGTNIGDDIVPEGAYQVKVYSRQDQKCLRCYNLIKKTTIAQRGTHFCPSCQLL